MGESNQGTHHKNQAFYVVAKSVWGDESDTSCVQAIGVHFLLKTEKQL